MIRHTLPILRGNSLAQPCMVAAILLLLIPGLAMAIEEPKYTVGKKDGNIEIRLYEPFIVAETVVDTTDFDEASNEGFRRLAGFIFGGNKVRQKIAMTSPVTTEQSQKIAMTAPVETERRGSSVRIGFTMPSEFTLETLPVPNDSRVTLRQVPARKLAVIRFSGRWTEENFREHSEELNTWIEKQGLKISGDPFIARYNPPFVPSFFRRNEVMIPVE
jgi:effector-binding domain-containing protein